MKMPKNLRYLFISALWLLSNYTTYTVAQNSVTLKDLPPCSEPCADTAAVAVGCDTDDIPCLCSHKNFPTATLQCSRDCRPDALSLTRQVLTDMCADVTSTTTTSSTSTSSTTRSRTTSTTSTSTSSTSQSSSTSTTSSTTVTPIPTSSLSIDTTQSGSSTVIVVQTVVVAQPSTIPNAAGRLDIGSASIALGALIFSLPPLILAVIAI